MTTASTKSTGDESAEAGRRGDDVRSDCWVCITSTQSGGIDLRFKSRVESMYGDATRKLVRDELDALGVVNARVEIEDAGALPFVIMARVETAVRRLLRRRADGIREDGGPTSGASAQAEACGSVSLGNLTVGEGYLPDFAPGTDRGTQRERFRRSRLYLPGNEPKFMLNAGLHGPDAIILDLEDSVAPAEKDAARVLVRNALRCIDFRSAERMVRINQGDRGLEDLDFIVPHNPHVILIPKAESPNDVRRVDDRIDELLRSNTQSRAAGFSARGVSTSDAPPSRAAGELQNGGSRSTRGVSTSDEGRGCLFLMPIIESALGAIRAYEIATASKNVVALTIGLEDYTADIGVARTKDGRESFWARSQVVNAARAAGVQPIDTVFSDVSDMDGLREAVLEAKSLGFDGKGCIHPRQIAVIHEAFAPTKEELEKARRIVAAFEEAEQKGLGVVSLGSKMIDPPVVKRAQRVVKLAQQMQVA